ncbi:alpha/beta hydrolase family protein [Enhygromyxa salina]|nr:CocE/NonD family hydrolase [Enhygromyxa salina]
MPGPRLLQALPSAAALALAMSVGPAGCRKTELEAPDTVTRPIPSTPYLARRHARDTKLRVSGPSPGKFNEYRPSSGVMAVTYPSGDLSLAAWYATPLGASGSNRAPALVYFHGDFAFGPDDFEAVRPFVDAGFVVMTPMLRGENGNPGDFELLWGEVDDARAAIEWVASQPMVDRRRIYAFGHSIGGGVAAMLSLYPTLPLRITGSCGGIYMPETFSRWAASKQNGELVRFDANDPEETELRVLGPNLAWMVHRHVAYVGDDDPWFVDNAAALERSAWALGKPFERVVVTGDHMQSLQPALAAFLALTQADLPPR